MSDQPIIYEDNVSSKLTKEEEPKRKEEEVLKPALRLNNADKFFMLLDGVEEYDFISKKIREKYQSAMLGLA